MAEALRKVAPRAAWIAGGVLLVGAALLARKATRFDLDLDLGWDDLPA